MTMPIKRNSRINRTYGQLFFENNEWILANIEPHVSIRLKKIFPKIPTYAVPPFTFKSTPEIDNELEWFMQRYPLEVSKADLKRLSSGSKAFNINLLEMDSILLPTFEPRESNNFFSYPNKQPRLYQWQMAEIITKKNNFKLS